MNEPKVWIRKRKTKRGKSYHLRWICPEARAWKSRHVGSDRRQAVYEAAKLEEQLFNGTYRGLLQTTWDAFVDDHVKRIELDRYAADNRRTLEEFGATVHPGSPKDVTYSMLELFVTHLRKRGNQPSTTNTKLRHLRRALNMAIKRNYLAVSAFNNDLFRKAEKKPPRVLKDGQEEALLDAADTLYGFRWRSFLYTALQTGGRRAELLSLPWGRVGFDNMRIHFAKTKSHKDRYVPIEEKMIAILRKLQAQTLVEGGPFLGMERGLDKRWNRIRKRAGVDVTLHDLRRTYCTRSIRAGVPLPTVQKLMGHANIKTTLEHYNWVSQDDLRDASRKLARKFG